MATGKDRERRLAREHFERQQARRAQARERSRRRNAWLSAALATALVVGGVGYLATAVGGSTDGAAPQAGDEPPPADTASPTPSASPSPTAAAGPCTYRKADPGGVETVGTPPARPGPPTPYRAVIATNRGTVQVELLTRQAPCTVGSFRFLADRDYFDRTDCHRLTTEGIFVLQCGDPSGTGRGGPGYEFDEENLPDPGGVTYPDGTLAMARTAQPGTNGSQFFLVHDDTTLPADYTVFGRVVGGSAVLDDIAAAGTADGSGDGPPERDVVVRDVRVTEQKA